MNRFVKTLVLACLDRIPERYRRALFCELAAKLPVSMIEISGRQGRLYGCLRDQVFREYVKTGDWSGHISQLIKAAFERSGSGTFLDIGGNIGLTFIPIAEDPRISCLAFEPEPTNFALLQRNVTANCPHDNTRLFNVALFDTDGMVTLELSRDNYGDHRVRTREPGTASTIFDEKSRRTILVEAKALDRVVNLDELRRPLVIKMDTQGAEQHIYAGGRAIFSAAIMLILEFWPYGIDRMGGDSERLIRCLEDDFRWAAFLRGQRLPGPGDALEIRHVARTLRTLATRKHISAANINSHDVVFVKDRSLLSA